MQVLVRLIVSAVGLVALSVALVVLAVLSLETHVFAAQVLLIQKTGQARRLFAVAVALVEPE